MCRLNRRVKTKWWVLFLLFFLLSTFIFAEEEKDLLDMTLEELMNVKITTAARSPEKIGEIPASVVLITREDIETYGYRTLDEILENIPGLYAIDDYEWGKNYGVRGFWSGVPNDNMIILVNGISQVDDFQSNYPLQKISIPVESIERIEVVRGPMSVIYGNGAFYGVINIFTNNFSKVREEKTIKDNSKNIVSGSYGSGKTKKVFLRFGGKESDLSYVFNASFYDTYGMDHPLAKMVRDTSILLAMGVPEDHRTGGRLEGNEKYFNFSGFFKNFYIDISRIESTRETFFLFPSPSNGHQYSCINTNLSIGFRKKFSEKIAFDGKFNLFQNRWSIDYDFLFEDFYGIQQMESTAWELDCNLIFKPMSILELNSGIYYRSISDVSNMYDLPSFGTPSLLNNHFYINDDDNIITQAIFTQITLKPISSLNIIAGIRFEQMPKYGLEAVLAGGEESSQKIFGTYSQDEIEVIPRFAAVYTINDSHFFKFLYGQAINRPSFFQNTQNILLEPNRGMLKPESIQTFELNYISSLSSNFTLNFSVFRNILENLITRVGEINDNGDYVTWSANAGKMFTHGSELTINVEPIENFRIELSGTYQKTDDKRLGYENIAVAYSPKLLGYLKTSYRTKRFTLALTGNYVGAMDTFWQANPGDLSGERIGDRVDGYFILGTNIRFENLFIKGLYLNIRCSNLLNEEIRYPTYTNNDWAYRGTLGIKRTILATIGIKF